MNELVIFGAGGHAKVVIETAFLCGFKPTAVYDDDASLTGSFVLEVPVKGRIKDLEEDFSGHIAIAIGSNRVRQKLSKRFAKASFPILVHPSAVVSKYAKVGAGSIVCAGAVIQTSAVIGQQVIINTSANIDHDCLVGDFVHICPGSNLAGGVQIGAGTLVSTGSSIIPLKTVGDWSIIGAGSVVIRDIPGKVVAFGVPAKVIKQNE